MITYLQVQGIDQPNSDNDHINQNLMIAWMDINNFYQSSSNDCLCIYIMIHGFINQKIKREKEDFVLYLCELFDHSFL